VGGDKNDLYLCAPASLGEDTACTPGFFWNAATHGLEGGNVRGFSLIPAEGVAGAQAVEPVAGQALHLPPSSPGRRQTRRGGDRETRRGGEAESVRRTGQEVTR
jgi:hypothetical protein